MGGSSPRVRVRSRRKVREVVVTRVRNGERPPVLRARRVFGKHESANIRQGSCCWRQCRKTRDLMAGWLTLRLSLSAVVSKVLAKAKRWLVT
jgi:hypothetical protein